MIKMKMKEGVITGVFHKNTGKEIPAAGNPHRVAASLAKSIGRKAYIATFEGKCQKQDDQRSIEIQ